MLESIVSVSIVDAYECLQSPDIAIHLVKTWKTCILNDDKQSLLTSAVNHTARMVAQVEKEVSWYSLWDKALDQGPRGTEQLQQIIYHLSRPIYDHFSCSLLMMPPRDVSPPTSWLSHLCSSHQVTLNSSTLSEQVMKEQDDIFNIVFPK